MDWFLDFLRGWWPWSLREQVRVERGYRRAAEAKADRLRRDRNALIQEAARWRKVAESMRREARS